MVYSDFSAFDSGIKGLTVDIFNNLLYWTVGNEIKYINLTEWEALGPGIIIDPGTVVRQPGMDPHGIAVVNNIIYWTEQRLVNQQTHQIDRPGAIYSLDMATNINQTLLRNGSLSPQDLSTFTNVSGMLEDSWCVCVCFPPIAECVWIHTHTHTHTHVTLTHKHPHYMHKTHLHDTHTPQSVRMAVLSTMETVNTSASLFQMEMAAQEHSVAVLLGSDCTQTIELALTVSASHLTIT